MNKVFTSIVISGGAMKVLTAIGCIKYLEERNMVQYLRNFVGTSAGALMCFFLVLGFKSNDIIDFLSKHLNDPTINALDASQFLNILTDYGITDGNNFMELFKRILHSRTRLEDITFMDLAKMTAKNLVICVSNLTDEKYEFLSVDTTPNMSVLLALRITCSIPLIFNPVFHNDKLYLDGALYNNFPINYFKDATLKDILGINISFSDYKKSDTILEYLLFMVFSLITKVCKNNSETYDCDVNNVVMINIDKVKWIYWDEMKIGFPKDDIDALIEIGYNQMHERFNCKRSLEHHVP